MAKEDISVKHRLVYFFENTSMQGIPHIYRSRQLARRVVWVLVMAACLGFLAYQLQAVIADYVEHCNDIKANIDVIQLRETVFPAVTICNQNPIRCKKANEYSIFVCANNDQPADGNQPEGENSENGTPQTVPGASTEHPQESQPPGGNVESSPFPPGEPPQESEPGTTLASGNQPPPKGPPPHSTPQTDVGFGGISKRSAGSEQDPGLQYLSELDTRIRYLTSAVTLNESERLDAGHQIESILLMCSYGGSEACTKEYDFHVTFCYYFYCSAFSLVISSPFIV